MLKVELKGKYVVKAHTNRPTGIQYTLSIRGKNISIQLTIFGLVLWWG